MEGVCLGVCGVWWSPQAQGRIGRVGWLSRERTRGSEDDEKAKRGVLRALQATFSSGCSLPEAAGERRRLGRPTGAGLGRNGLCNRHHTDY